MSGSVAELTGRVLADLGVGYAFGVVGSGNFELTNALRAHGVPWLAARHEGGAASMADGFSRLSPLPAVVTTHQGCGLTNATTGIGEAAKSRTPIIVLTADSQASATNSNFKIDQDAIATSVGAVAERVHGPQTATADLTRAYRRAVDGRQTVVVSLPLDVLAAAAPEYEPIRFARPEPTRPAASSVTALARLLDGAQRPVFVAGRGARAGGRQLRELAERTGALLATSAVANGLFEGDDFDLGISGGFSSPLTAQLIADADVLVGWGCALNMWTMRHGSLIGASATVAQVDDTASALGAHRPVDLAVLGDVAVTAEDVRAALEVTKQGYRTDEIAEQLANRRWWNQTPTEDLSSSDRIDPRLLSRELDAALPAERVLSIDSGNFMGYPSAYLRVPDENGFCFTQAFQSIGLGLASGIGAALAQPDRLAVVGTGDGGFLMGISELETAVRLGRPMVVVVYNDAAYGAEVHHFGEADMSTVTFPDVDIARLAAGFGAHGITVRTRGDLDAVRDWATSPSGVLVVDAKIANDGGSWWLAEAFKGH